MIRSAISWKRSKSAASRGNRCNLVGVLQKTILGLVLLAFAVQAYAEEDPSEVDFLGAVDQVVKAIEAEDYETFESYFSENSNACWAAAT